MAQVTRRDFLKLTSLFAAGTISTLTARSRGQIEHGPNLIIILFDAMSALHMSLYGYGRETTPELSRFAERCTVYNAHYSASNFTTSGTASMLTGMYPWKHRALTQGGIVKRDIVPYNPYTLLGSDYHRLMFSQNFWPDRLVAQYYDQVDDFLPQTAYSMRGNTLVKSWLGKDRLLASIAFDEFLFPAQTDRPGSAFLNYFYKSRVSHSIETQKIQPGYPNGVPEVEGYNVYQNEQIYKGVLEEILNLQDKQPSFAYFHLFSPHSPYKPGGKFSRLFRNDGFQIPPKEIVPEFASLYTETEESLLRKRTAYDRQIAQVDAEVGKLIDQLEASGVLDSSYLILTSDHGEMFERGFSGHGGRLMYEPVLRIPLLIHAPEQNARKDINIPTSNVDLLPTLLSIAGKEIPEVVEGQVLAGFSGVEDKQRPIFSMAAWQNSAFLPITKAGLAMRKGAYKLIVYLGYGGKDGIYELYNLEEDPEELRELSKSIPSVFLRMKEEFFGYLAAANRPFEQ
ncbi:MAG TPA: sulfatase [Anaerolineales bacterium]|nr:sulfatase [Anaerolineales bacterium]